MCVMKFMLNTCYFVNFLVIIGTRGRMAYIVLNRYKLEYSNSITLGLKEVPLQNQLHGDPDRGLKLIRRKANKPIHHLLLILAIILSKSNTHLPTFHKIKDDITKRE